MRRNWNADGLRILIFKEQKHRKIAEVAEILRPKKVKRYHRNIKRQTKEIKYKIVYKTVLILDKEGDIYVVLDRLL